MNYIHEIISSSELQFYSNFIEKVKSKNFYLADNCVKLGKIEYLAYAYENGCPWDNWTCQHASANGQLKCLRYALKNGCSFDKQICIEEAKNPNAVIALFDELNIVINKNY